jgi:hypothetical protein
VAYEYIVRHSAQVGRDASQDEPDETMVVQGGDDQLPQLGRQASLRRHCNNRGGGPTPGETSDSGLLAGMEVPLWSVCARNARDELFHGSGEASAVSWLWGRSRGRFCCSSSRVEGSSRSGVWRSHAQHSRRRSMAPGSGGDYGQRAVVFWDPALLRAGRTQRRAIKRIKHRIVRPWQGRPLERVAVATGPRSADRGRLSIGQTALKHAPR